MRYSNILLIFAAVATSSSLADKAPLVNLAVGNGDHLNLLGDVTGKRDVTGANVNVEAANNIDANILSKVTGKRDVVASVLNVNALNDGQANILSKIGGKRDVLDSIVNADAAQDLKSNRLSQIGDKRDDTLVNLAVGNHDSLNLLSHVTGKRDVTGSIVDAEVLKSAKANIASVVERRLAAPAGTLLNVELLNDDTINVLSDVTGDKIGTGAATGALNGLKRRHAKRRIASQH